MSGASHLGRDCPSRASRFLEIANYCPGGTSLTCTFANPEPKLRTVSAVWLLHTRRQYSSALVIVGPGTRQLETSPRAQSPPNYSYQSKTCSAAYPASLIPSLETHSRDSCPCSPLASYWPWCLFMWPCSAWHPVSSREL